MIELEKTTSHSVVSYDFKSVNGCIMAFGGNEREAIEKAIIEAEKQRKNCIYNIEKFTEFIEEGKRLLEKY